MFWLYPSLAMFIAGPDPAPAPPAGPAVTLGLEVLLEDHLDLLAGKRIGLLTHPAAVDANLVPSVDRLVSAGRKHGFKVVQLYGPEHGIRGWMSAAEKTGADIDPYTKLPVENLFGLGKRGRPSKRSLDRIDLLVVDLQDLGSRTYTYISTLGEAMIAAHDAGKKVIVLDRPNPAGGLVFEGPVLRHKRRSFVGWSGLPVTHGMTIGEMAEFYRKYEDVECDLQVIPMRGWKRGMTWRETGLHWVPTSPGIPHIENALLYPATGMIGGVSENVSEGVGTTLPFEQVGAEWIDALAFEKALTALALPGVRFRATTFRPNWFDHKGKLLHGIQLVVTHPPEFRPIRTALGLLTTLEKLWPGETKYRDNFDTIWGSMSVLEAARAGRSVTQVEATFKRRLDAFAEERASVLIYKD